MGDDKTEEQHNLKEVADDAGSKYGEWFKRYMHIFSRRFVEWLAVFLFGYYNLSFGWLMAPLFFLVLRDKRSREKKVKFDIIRSIANAEEKDLLQEIQRFANLPSWVTFPDMERVEWLNKIVRQLWPYAGHYVHDLCKFSIEPSIRSALEEYKLSGFKFEKIILGDTPFRLSGVKVYDDTSRHEIIMDMDFAYAGDCKFEVSVSKFKMGIKDLQISGRMRVVMKPLVRQIPLVGGLQVFFLNNPDVDFNLIGLADVFDMPGLSDILRSIVTEQIAHMMVLPNRYPIQLVDDINIAELKCPAPAGVLRIHVIEAQNLMKKDVGLMGMGKSDPYCILRLGAQKFQTKTINNTVNPKWDYSCEFVVNDLHGQELKFELFDVDDGLNEDDILGRANLDVHDIWQNGEVDMWIPLSDAKSGRIHVKASWLDLDQSAEALDQQLEEIRALQTTTKTPLHSAVLLVWIDSAKKLNSIPDPSVRVHVGNSQQETTPRQRTNDPVFEEGFTFLVRNPKTQELKVEVMDNKTNTVIGKIEVDLKILLKERKLEIMNEEYMLSGTAGSLASLKMNLSLRILKTVQKKTENETATAIETGEANTVPPTPSLPTTTTNTTNTTTTTTTTSPEQPHTTPTPTAAAPVSRPTPINPPIESGKEEERGEGGEREGEGGTETVMTAATAPHTQTAAPSAPLSATAALIAAAAATAHTGDGDDHQATAATVIRQRQPDRGVHGLGRIELTVKYGQRNNLIIVVHRVYHLPLEEDGEEPDPYVKVYLLPDRSRDSKRKTDVRKDSCSPQFDERFEYSIPSNELTKRKLEVSVINKKGIRFMQRSSTMGQVLIDCGLLDPSKVTQMYDLCPPSDEDEE